MSDPTVEPGWRFLDPDELDNTVYIHMHQVEAWIRGHWYSPVWPNNSRLKYRTKLSRQALHFRMGYSLRSWCRKVVGATASLQHD